MPHRRPKDSLKPAQKLKRHEPHHGAQIPHRTSQPNRIKASGSQVSILLSSFPVCGCQSASGCFQRSKWSFALLHSLMTSNNSTFIEHLYILTLMDISFCAGLFRSSKDHHARRVLKIKARSIAVTVSYSLWGEALS